MKLIKTIDNSLVFLTMDKNVVTTSRVLANRFGKHHKDVLAIIDGLKARHPDKLTGPKLRLSAYADADMQYQDRKEALRIFCELYRQKDAA